MLDTIIFDRADDGNGQIGLRTRSISDETAQVRVAYQARFGGEDDILILDQGYSRPFTDSQSWHSGRFVVAEIVSSRKSN